MEWLRLTSLSCSLAASFFQSRPANDAQISVSQNTPKLKISQTFKTFQNFAQSVICFQGGNG